MTTVVAVRTALYRLYDANDTLLYVGVSDRPLTRWAQHADEKPWWPKVAKITFTWCDSREQALADEIKAIGEEQPRHNSPRWKLSTTPGPTKNRVMRLDDSLWSEFGHLCKQQGVTKAEVVRALIRWYLRRPGAKLPERPTVARMAEVQAARTDLQQEASPPN